MSRIMEAAATNALYSTRDRRADSLPPKRLVGFIKRLLAGEAEIPEHVRVIRQVAELFALPVQ